MTKKDLSNKSQKKEIDEKNEEGSGRNSAGARPKVVMLLVDALREDFVDFDIPTGKYQKVRASPKLDKERKDQFQGEKISILKQIALQEPENAILLPMATDLPTVTTVKVKSIVSGSMSSFFETKEDFASDVMPEDNIIH